MSKIKKISITVKEFLEFGKSISDDWYFDESILPEEDLETFPPQTKIDIGEGDIQIVWQGPTIDPPKGESDQKEFITEFLKWRESLTHKTFFIKVKNEDIDRIRTLLNDQGIKLEE